MMPLLPRKSTSSIPTLEKGAALFFNRTPFCFPNLVFGYTLLLLVGGAAGELCPDGSTGLTKELYTAGDPSKYADVSCIPENEFFGYSGDVTLDGGLDKLISIGDSAFCSIKGTLIIKGRFPLLSSIGRSAFSRMGGPPFYLLDICFLSTTRTLAPGLSCLMEGGPS